MGAMKATEDEQSRNFLKRHVSQGKSFDVLQFPTAFTMDIVGQNSVLLKGIKQKTSADLLVLRNESLANAYMLLAGTPEAINGAKGLINRSVRELQAKKNREWW